MSGLEERIILFIGEEGDLIRFGVFQCIGGGDDGIRVSLQGSPDVFGQFFQGFCVHGGQILTVILDDAVLSELSFGAIIQLAENLNANEPIDGLLWALLYSRIPEALKDTVLNPFVSIDENQLRFNVRVIESADDLNRNELLQRNSIVFWRVHSATQALFSSGVLE